MTVINMIDYNRNSNRYNHSRNIPSMIYLYCQEYLPMKKILVTVDLNSQQKNHFITNVNNATIDFINRKEVTEEILEKYDAVIGNINPRLLNKPIIKWLHLESAGADRFTKINSEIILTNSSGAYGEAIGEYLITAVFTLTKRFNQYIKTQINHNWNYLGKVRQIKDSVVTVVGLGNIGNTFSKKMHALGAKVYGVKRNIDHKPDYIEKLYTMDNMEEILKVSDIVVLILPSTPSTKNYFNYDKLKMINPDALLINVGRGDTVVTEDLIKLLEEGHFYGVCLDVVHPEPLPINSKLWQFDNVIITPHVSGNYSMDYTLKKVIDIAVVNINNFVNNQPLINVINKDEGY